MNVENGGKENMYSLLDISAIGFEDLVKYRHPGKPELCCAAASPNRLVFHMVVFPETAHYWYTALPVQHHASNPYPPSHAIDARQVPHGLSVPGPEYPLSGR